MLIDNSGTHLKPYQTKVAREKYLCYFRFVENIHKIMGFSQLRI